MKVAVVSTHPIQYHTPWFQKLAALEQIALTVYYATMPDREQQGVGFDVPFAWDIPLLDGYRWELLPNKRKSPNLRGFLASRHRRSIQCSSKLARRSHHHRLAVTAFASGALGVDQAGHSSNRARRI
jgi:hypothetical protein